MNTALTGENIPPRWLVWARLLQAIAQNGLTYSANHFDRERYEAVRDIAAEMMAVHQRRVTRQRLWHSFPRTRCQSSR